MLGLTADQIGTIILGLSIGLISVMGGQKGRNLAQGKSGSPQDTIEVAGAIVSDKSVSRMVQSLDEFSSAATVLKAAIDRDVAAKTALTEALTVNSRALHRNSETADDMLAGVRDTSNHLDRLRDELIRNHRS